MMGKQKSHQCADDHPRPGIGGETSGCASHTETKITNQKPRYRTYGYTNYLFDTHATPLLKYRSIQGHSLMIVPLPTTYFDLSQ
jgi:hypothetical protein